MPSSSSSWRPNPNAKPFHPNSAFYSISILCRKRPLRVQKRGILGRIVQWVLVVVLCITVVINIVFILDTTAKARENNFKLGKDAFEDQNPRDKTIKLNEEDDKHKIRIQIYSSKDLALITVDGTKVLEANDPEKGRGISVVVLNQATGAVMATRTFDTFAAKDDSDSLVLFTNMVTDGRILCFTVKDEGSKSLKTTARNLMRILGSDNFSRLGWRDSWGFVVQKRGKTYAEGFQKSKSLDTWAEPVSFEVSVPLHSVEESECHWEDTEANKRRKDFCSKYEGYGSVCSCSNPAAIDIESESLPNNQQLELPVAVIASNRPHYLYRMLRSMLSAVGARADKVTVFIDGYFEEPLAVAKLFGVRGIQHTPVSSKNARISQHYKASLSTTFNLYPKAQYMIIIEEDLDVSPDLFNYFQQLLPLMNQDDSIYCISAWNDQGYDHTVGDKSMLYRVETMPGLGWVLKRKLYKDELEPQWPTPDKFWDWDMWMRLPEIRKGRECVIPDISRTYHFGAKGLNMHPYFQELYFKKHALNTDPNVKLNVEVMKKENYEKEIERLLGIAEVLDHSKNPCIFSDFIPTTKGKTYVFYIKMDHPTDWVTWNSVSKCFHIWDLDVRGFHKSMWRLWFNSNHVLIVGSPASPYSKHKPATVTPIYIPKKETPKQK